MTLFEAIILGIVQGLTEFLPISSTAHLRIVPALFGWEDPGAAFTAIIQIGTLVAVLIYFKRDIAAILRGVLTGLVEKRPLGNREAKMGWMIAAGTVPIVCFGLLFKEHIETTLRSLYWISAALILLALVLSVAEWRIRRRLESGNGLREIGDIGWKDAILIGLAQSIALIPGSSRSGTTITGALFLNLSREAAARFSFLLSLPSIFAAGMYELYSHWEVVAASGADMVNLAAATLAAGVVGYAAIAFLLSYLKRHTTSLFIVYRIVAGVGLLGLLSAGILQP